MAEQTITLSDFDTAISDKMDELISRRNDTWDFIDAPHSLKDIEARLKDIRAVGKDISAIPMALNAHKKAYPDDSNGVDTLLQNYRILHGYVLEIQDCLDKDAVEKAKEIEGKKLISLKMPLSFLVFRPFL